MDMTKLLETATAEARAGLPDLLASIRVAGISARGERLDESAAFHADLLQRDGWRADVVRAGDNPCVLAEIGEGPRSVLVYGHHDVQPVEPLAAWESPPFEPAVRDGRLFARGSADNKGQFFAHIFAVRALRRVAGGVPARVRLILDGQEEMGSPHAARLVEENRERLAADFMYTADGPVHGSGRPVVTFGVRGVCKLRLTVRTAGSDLHSGNWGNLAPNAAMRMAQILADMKGADGLVKVPGFYDDVMPPTPAEREALAAIPYDAAGELASIGACAPVDGPADRPAMERLMFLPTFNVTGISGGYTGPGFKTVIPAEVAAQIDVRLVVRQDPRRIFALLRDWLAARAPDATLEFLGSYQPSRTPMDAPCGAVVAEAVRQGFGQAPLLYPALGGSSPDAAFAQGLGIPSLLVPYGNPDERNHAPNENLRLDYLEAGTRTSAALFAGLGA